MKKTILIRDILLISNPLGQIMQGIGVVTMIPLIIALIYGEPHLIVFLVLGLLSIGIGSSLRRIPFDGNRVKLALGSTHWRALFNIHHQH